LITAQHITKSFGDFEALHDVSLEIPSGSLTALLGPSGSGKSTLLRVIAGLEVPDAGSVVIDDVDATALPPQKRGIGFVFQHYAAFKHMTVRGNVAFGLTVRKRPKAEIDARVKELLGIVGLAGYADRYPSQLSGGQRQRMALARALAVEPSVLLLDEPFGALDNQTRVLMQEMLLGIWEREQKTVLFVTHDIEEAIFLGSRVIVMSARPGRIKAEIAIDLPHPRSYKIKTAPEFVKLKERLVEEIRAEALKVAVDA